jgi:hypothetical protein
MKLFSVLECVSTGVAVHSVVNLQIVRVWQQASRYDLGNGGGETTFYVFGISMFTHTEKMNGL